MRGKYREMDLPNEIWEIIFLSSPDPKTFMNLSHICKKLLEISLWKRIQRRMMDLFSVKKDIIDDKLNVSMWVLPNGRPHGPYTSFYKNGDLWKEGNYKNGKKHGRWRQFTLGKLPIELSHWKNGKMNGKFKMYSVYFDCLNFKMGRTLLSRGIYKNDKKTGEWIETDNSGKKVINYS